MSVQSTQPTTEPARRNLLKARNGTAVALVLGSFVLGMAVVVLMDMHKSHQPTPFHTILLIATYLALGLTAVLGGICLLVRTVRAAMDYSPDASGNEDES